MNWLRTMLSGGSSGNSSSSSMREMRTCSAASDTASLCVPTSSTGAPGTIVAMVRSHVRTYVRHLASSASRSAMLNTTR